MQDSSLPPEISRLYADLADRIIARDEEGASRIYYELLRAGRPLEILADATRVPALRKTLELALFGERAVKEQGSKIPDEPPRQDSALPKVARQSIIDRAVQRVDWTIASKTLHETPHGRDDVASEQPRPGPSGIVGLGFGARLCLASVLIAVPASTGIFLLTRPAVEEAVTESTPAEEAPAQARRRGASSSGGSAVAPPAGGVMQGTAPAGTTAASVPTAPELEANLTSGPPLFIAPPGGPGPNTTTTLVVSSPGTASTGVVGAPATRPGEPEPNAATAPPAPPPEATSTAATPARPKPSVEQGFSAPEIATLLERGNALSRTGDVASARLFYERAADAGEAQGAVRLAETFDPVFLYRAYLRGVRSDFDAAVFWYRRARELGATEVADRLKALEAKQRREPP